MAQSSMLFFSFFKSLAEQSQVPARVVLELKNGVKIAGTLEQVDESLNFHLSAIQTLKPDTSLQDC
jgi:small nuclear ribonucleoprotein (snRNP)-like protein